MKTNALISSWVSKPAIIMLTMLSALTGISSESKTSPDQEFVKGTVAYDEGRYPEASAAFEHIIQQGYATPQIFYNAGNSWFKQGDFSRAALYYLRAKTLTPRDTELNANLDFTFQQVDAPREPWSIHKKVAQLLSLQEWQKIATIAFWLSTLSFFVSLVYQPLRFYSLRIGAGLGIATTCCLPPILLLKHSQKHPQTVLLKDSSARYAPLDNAAVHFEIPQGSIAVQVDMNGGWIKIRSQGKEAWVNKTDAHPVFPLDSLPSP